MEEEKPKKKRKKKADEGVTKKHKKNWRETQATAADIRQMLTDNVLLRQNVITAPIIMTFATMRGPDFLRNVLLYDEYFHLPLM